MEITSERRLNVHVERSLTHLAVYNENFLFLLALEKKVNNRNIRMKITWFFKKKGLIITMQ